MKTGRSITLNTLQRCAIAMLLLGCGTTALAQTAPSSLHDTNVNAAAPPSAPAQRSPADLEKLVAPIALYPDPLLATLLPASAYPLEIVQAARFIKDTNNLSKLETQKWDENVKAIARFPQVVAQMNENIAWTSDLGDAFINQPKEVMDAIQTLRKKAQESGALKTTPQQVVSVTNTVVTNTVQQQTVYVTNPVVQIQPARPEVIYVPQYNPTVVYAGYPVAYPGYYYPPPAPYYGSVAAASVVSFGAGMAVGAILANNCDWGHGGCWSGSYHSDVDIERNVNVNRNANVNRSANANLNRTGNANANRGQKWQPDQSRLRSSGSTLSSSQSREARGWGSASTQSASATPRASGATARASPTGPAASRASAPNASRSSASPRANRASAPSVSRSTPSRSAFSGGSGSQTRMASSRGSFSRGGGGGGRRR